MPQEQHRLQKTCVLGLCSAFVHLITLQLLLVTFTIKSIVLISLQSDDHGALCVVQAR